MMGSTKPVGPMMPNNKLSTSVFALIYALALKLFSSGLLVYCCISETSIYKFTEYNQKKNPFL